MLNEKLMRRTQSAGGIVELYFVNLLHLFLTARESTRESSDAQRNWNGKWHLFALLLLWEISIDLI
jgi:hypothetical protein